MSRRKLKSVPIWKQGIALLCAVYLIAVWVIPVFLLPFVNVLPYVHQATFLQRFLGSCVGTAIVFLTLFALGPKQFLRNMSSAPATRWERAKHWLALALGFAMFTYMGAELSPNLFGALTHALPGNAYEESFQVEDATTHGSRYRSVSLVLRSHPNEASRYLVISKRLFDYPQIRRGDVLKVSGRKTAVGIYVTNFEVKPAS